MIYRLLILGLFVILFTACEEEDSFEESKSCLSNLTGTKDSALLSSTELKHIDSIFKLKNIDASNLQFIYGSQSSGSIVVIAYQYVNGLRVFNSQPRYYFTIYPDSLSVYLSGERVYNINVPSSPISSRKEVFNVYRTHIRFDPSLAPTKDFILNGCFDYELGYYPTSSIGMLNWRLAWKISRQNDQGPKIYVDDENLEVLSYSSF